MREMAKAPECLVRELERRGTDVQLDAMSAGVTTIRATFYPVEIYWENWIDFRPRQMYQLFAEDDIWPCRDVYPS